ncbi:SDR family oxidoreductase [Nocardioides sp. SYSU DS0663]|uniref:SDR family oxidoreductase n=1 Tax=Nocardioides sp. SYSU DS0663 TaxID=3416445 RepID=UPI003F4C40B7
MDEPLDHQQPPTAQAEQAPGAVDAFSLEVFSLAGKRAIVTGGNTGLGHAFSVALASAGADVFVPSIAKDDGVTARAVTGHGRRYVAMQADLTRPGVPKQVVSRCVEELGGLDILVNSAGICLLADVADFDRTQWDPMVAVNLTAAFEIAHAASAEMVRQEGGKIVNIASLFSFLGGQQSPAYAATKAGIVGFTKAYCDELARHHVQVNAIAPGYFATEITTATRSDLDANRRIVEHIPAGRWGDPADLMGALVFLASSASDYVNGHVLVVDGGYLVR